MDGCDVDYPLTLTVTVENCSPHTWPALPDAWGRHRINLANHWLYSDGELMQRDDARCPLDHDLRPGSRQALILYVTTPPFDLDYIVEVDLVQENVGWFAARGSKTLHVPCQVTGGLPGPPPRRPSPEVAPPPPRPRPFRERHPRICHTLRATGMRDLYWAWRRGLDAVKGRRDRLIWRPKDRAYQPLFPPLINRWNRLSLAPGMEMHCVPRGEVLALLAEGGARIVDVEEELTAGAITVAVTGSERVE